MGTGKTGRSLSAKRQAFAEQAVQLWLKAIGEDPSRAALADTPRLVAEAIPELFGGVAKDPVAELEVLTCGANAEVHLEDLAFVSWCEHHLLPFYGRANVAYQPADGRVTGLGSIARALWTLSRRPQIQERLTEELAAAVGKALRPEWVEVDVTAVHLCLVARGARAEGSHFRTHVRLPHLGSSQ